MESKWKSKQNATANMKVCGKQKLPVTITMCSRKGFEWKKWKKENKNKMGKSNRNNHDTTWKIGSSIYFNFPIIFYCITHSISSFHSFVSLFSCLCFMFLLPLLILNVRSRTHIHAHQHIYSPNCLCLLFTNMYSNQSIKIYHGIIIYKQIFCLAYLII